MKIIYVLTLFLIIICQAKGDSEDDFYNYTGYVIDESGNLIDWETGEFVDESILTPAERKQIRASVKYRQLPSDGYSYGKFVRIESDSHGNKKEYYLDGDPVRRDKKGGVIEETLTTIQIIVFITMLSLYYIRPAWFYWFIFFAIALLSIDLSIHGKDPAHAVGYAIGLGIATWFLGGIIYLIDPLRFRK